MKKGRGIKLMVPVAVAEVDETVPFPPVEVAIVSQVLLTEL